MARFLEANWIWILLIGAILFMHFGRRHGGMGGMGGCGGGGHGTHDNQTDDHAPFDGHSGHSQPPGPQPDADRAPDDQRSATTPARRHGGC